MNNEIQAKTNSVANPGPLRLCAFGMTTILLNLHNSGLNAMIFAMGLFYGGTAQVIAVFWRQRKIILSVLKHLLPMAFFGFLWLCTDFT